MWNINKACDIMGCQFYSTEHFILSAIHWLSITLGDLHIEFHEFAGWGISCCYEEKSWRDWIYDEELDNALAKAIVEVNKHEN